MKRVLVVGYQRRTQRMYPHTYDVLNVLQKHCELDYYGGDDRGFVSYCLGAVPASVNIRRWARFFLYFGWACIRTVIVQIEIRRRMKGADVIIAVDHSALHYVSKFKRTNQQLIFWSHDLISPDEPWMSSRWTRRLLRQNREDIQQASLVIVQDPRRAAVLDSTLNSHHIPKFFLPVCLASSPESPLQAEARSRRSPNGTVSLMQLGAIQLERNSHVILAAFQGFPANVRLYFKGFVSPEVKAIINAASRKPIVCPASTTFQEMRETIRLADIGIIACALKTLNTQFFSMASGQLAEFSRLGIPVIVLDMEEMGEFVVSQRCGVAIEGASELPAALDRIVRDYRNYSLMSFRTHTAFFELGRYEDGLVGAIGLSS